MAVPKREETKQEMDKEKNIDEIGEVVSPIVQKPTTFVPKTSLGRDVVEGRVKDISEIFASGRKILEPEIVDYLLPNLSMELILIGGSTGKGGGIRRIAVKRTSRMHKSGRRYRIAVLAVVGNMNGYLGVGYAKGSIQKHSEVIAKAVRNAKLNIFPVARGCGNWECTCGKEHSIPFATWGKSGSVRVKLMPAPRGIKLVVSDEIKKVLVLAGIKDVWCKSYGNTASRVNHVYAVVNALKKLSNVR